MNLKFRVGKYRYNVDVELAGSKMNLRFHYHPDLIEEIKSMAGARWNPEKYYWTIDCSPRNLFTIQFLCEKNPYEPYDAPLIDFVPRRKECYKHQIEQASHIITRRQCIVACEMGTGKTLAAMEAMEASGITDWFWIGPKSALYSVKLEFEKWKICDICGKYRNQHTNADHPWLETKCIKPLFYTYESLKKMVEVWPKTKAPPQGIVFDESSRCKNPTAQRSQAALILANNMREHWKREAWIIEMSGSPAPKSPLDWWSQAEIACPGFLKEGTIQKLQKRLAVIEQRENLVTGGVYPHLICWRDSVNRCERCGLMKDNVSHDFGAGGHTFQPCTDEVSKLYQRMKGLVLVKFKKDCLDLPEKQYKIIELKPTNEMLRCASLINSRSVRAIEALTLLRELSDGFQYKETEVGKDICPSCGGNRTKYQFIDLDDPDAPLDALSIECGRHVIYDEAGSPTVTDRPLNLGKKEVACDACDGTGDVIRTSRTSVEVKSPKEEALIELIDEHDDVGRIVIYGGFTGTIDKIIKIVLKVGWKFIRVDGRGWITNLQDRTPVDMLRRFQDPYNEDKIAFIGQPSSAGMGLNLTRSPSIVYYSNDFNAESRIQSEDRIHRPGMDLNRGATIYDLVLLPSDLLVINNLKRKRRLQDLSLGQMREEIEALKWSDVRQL